MSPKTSNVLLDVLKEWGFPVKEETLAKPTCANCAFSHPRGKDDRETFECRRRAPGSYANVNYPTTGTRFPLMHATSWCGEHKK